MPLVTFMYLEFSRMQAASLLQAMEVFVVVFAKRLSSTINELTLLFLTEHGQNAYNKGAFGPTVQPVCPPVYSNMKRKLCTFSE